MSTQRPYTDAEWTELQTENALLREAARELLQEAPDALAAAHAQIESLAAGIEEARQHYRVQLAELGQRCNALEKERDELRAVVEGMTKALGLDE